MTDGEAKPRCLAITGPTACGKTDLALMMAEEFPLEIISMDSAMVYRGMDIGTAKPGPAILDGVRHHLIDIRDPEQIYSAGEFAADARALISAINQRGKLALITGGTMLYLKSLRDGIADLPERDPDIRAEIDRRAASEGWPALHAELAQVDPVAAGKIEPADRQRIQRALEVFAITGTCLTDLQRDAAAPSFDVPGIALIPSDRARLGRDIAQRFDAMLAAGLVDEVRSLRERPGLSADSTSMRSVGYRQIWSWLDGNTGWDEAVDRAVIATRQLAKRQMTWLRSDRNSVRLGTDEPGRFDTVRSRIRECLFIT